MIVFPNAKINLGLCVTGKRNDGYHDIESLFYPVSLTDILEAGYFKNDTGTVLQITGNLIEGNTENNLVTQAIAAFQNYLEKSGNDSKREQLHQLSFVLHKIIPTGAGLGGGSADGSFALHLINQLLELNVSVEDLEFLALQLGSDCPFFIRNKPALVKGRGEMITPIELDLANYHLVLIHPAIHVSTAEAYRNISIQPSGIDWNEIIKTPVSEWKNVLRNDFEKTVFEKHPEIKTIKEKLYELGAEYAQMSGSGSAVYGLFAKEISKKLLQEKFDNPDFTFYSAAL